MAVVAHGFTHFDETFRKGQKVADDHPLVALAPHLFVQPDEDARPAGKAKKEK